MLAFLRDGINSFILWGGSNYGQSIYNYNFLCSFDRIINSTTLYVQAPNMFNKQFSINPKIDESIGVKNVSRD